MFPERVILRHWCSNRRDLLSRSVRCGRSGSSDGPSFFWRMDEPVQSRHLAVLVARSESYPGLCPCLFPRGCSTHDGRVLGRPSWKLDWRDQTTSLCTRQGIINDASDQSSCCAQSNPTGGCHFGVLRRIRTRILFAHVGYPDRFRFASSRSMCGRFHQLACIHHQRVLRRHCNSRIRREIIRLGFCFRNIGFRSDVFCCLVLLFLLGIFVGWQFDLFNGRNRRKPGSHSDSHAG